MRKKINKMISLSAGIGLIRISRVLLAAVRIIHPNRKLIFQKSKKSGKKKMNG